ncbi:3-phosphoglycerate dehydrogenase [Burkholderia gladioli]|nr:3-phosphoglycerate dehydrogenase [Burkholderia gladioli]MBU9269979.1 3-phosphoglycerate dehydrogenase [Burkholderia gladioli]
MRRGQPIHVVNPEMLARARTPGDDAVEALVLDLLEWIGSGARPYGEMMEAWRTSCPRLPVREEAGAPGYLERNHALGGVAEVRVSETGAAYLRARRKTPG